MVYYSMKNLAGVIEGNTEDISAFSDLSPSSNLVGCVTVRKDVVALKMESLRALPLCQSVPNPPMKVGDSWATIGRAANLPNGSMHGFHAVGTTDEENKAGRWINIPEQSLLLRVVYGAQCRNSGGSGATLRAVSLRKPAIEKEARLRPQHLTFSRSRMGRSARCSCEGGGRCPASAIRIFGGGVDLSNQSSLWRN